MHRCNKKAENAVAAPLFFKRRVQKDVHKLKKQQA